MIISKLEDIRRMVEEVYGKDRVAVKKIGKKDIEIIIHFPELTISNSEEWSRTLYDFFFCANIYNIDEKEDMKANIAVSGMRTTLTLKEIASGYTHSHLPSGMPIGTWSGFCLGSSDFRAIMNSLSLTLEEDDWYMFLYSIKGYLEWESLEGGPYVRMRNLRFGNPIAGNVLNKELGRIIVDCPHSAFEFLGELGLMLVEGRPEYEEFLDRESVFRDNTIVTQEQIDRDMKRYLENCVSPYEFNGKSYPPTIIPDVVVKDGHISKSLVDGYSSVLKKSLKSFNKKLEYERRKAEAAVGEDRII